MSETIFNKLENIGYPALTIFGPLSAFDCFRERAFLAGFVWLALVGGAIYEMVKRHRKKEGWTVKLGRACPSCGNRTAQFDSPLGEQLIEQWRTAPAVDPEHIEAVRSVISTAGEMDLPPRTQLIAKQPPPPANGLSEELDKFKRLIANAESRSAIDPQHVDAASALVPFAGDQSGEAVVDG